VELPTLIVQSKTLIAKKVPWQPGERTPAARRYPLHFGLKRSAIVTAPLAASH
jgi:hypothetical protein